MILLPRSAKVFVATQPVDMRKSFDGLSNAAREVLHGDPLSGDDAVAHGVVGPE